MRKSMMGMMLCVAAGCAEPPASAPAASGPTASATATNAVALVKFTCPTMHWGGCRSTVTSTLESLPGVANLNIDAKDRIVTVSGDPKTFVVDDAVAALKDCGFPAETTETLVGSWRRLEEKRDWTFVEFGELFFVRSQTKSHRRQSVCSELLIFHTAAHHTTELRRAIDVVHCMAPCHAEGCAVIGGLTSCRSPWGRVNW